MKLCRPLKEQLIETYVGDQKPVRIFRVKQKEFNNSTLENSSCPAMHENLLSVRLISSCKLILGLDLNMDSYRENCLFSVLFDSKCHKA